MKADAPTSRTEYRVSRRTKHYGVFSCERCGLGIDGRYILLSYNDKAKQPKEVKEKERYHEKCFQRFQAAKT